MTKRIFFEWYIFLLVSLAITACKVGNNTSSSLESNLKEGFVGGAVATQDETYQNIVSNSARLQAMLTGKFVQYFNTNTPTKPPNYVTWMVNEEKDSVVIYSVPVNLPTKEGRWIYHYHIMTSLPDEPIYRVFEKLIERDRDTIDGVFYTVPDDFDLKLDVLIDRNRNAFNDIELKKLKLDDTEKITYIRQNPLWFRAETDLVPDDYGAGYVKSIYNVKPKSVGYLVELYTDPEGKKQVDFADNKFIKLEMVN